MIILIKLGDGANHAQYGACLQHYNVSDRSGLIKVNKSIKEILTPGSKEGTG